MALGVTARRLARLLGQGALVVTALALLTPVATLAQPGKLEASYVVLGGEGAIARAILSGATECPMIKLGAAAQRMRERASPDEGANPAFPVLVCEALIPPGTRSAAIGAHALPLPQAKPAAIAVLGDTGCRLKAEDEELEHDDDDPDRFQACNSRSRWPFSRLSRTAAARKPGLVVHVGDYLYRESPCPAGDKGCKGSPYGDNWRAWQADFFRPAAPLLAAAPWIMVRGNHESCARAGVGYFRFLHPALARDQAPPACTELVAPYALDVGGTSFIVMDTSNAADECANDGCDSAPYAAQFETLAPKPGAWLLSHRPIWGVGRSFTMNRTLQQALAGIGGRLPAGVALVLSGHMHIFELLNFADGRPPQFIVGSGGTALDRPVDRKLKGMAFGGARIESGRSEHRFGFLMVAPSGKGFSATFVDAAGRTRFRCAVRPGRARCA